MRPKRIILVGLGLIGGSLAAACRKAFPRIRIIGVTRNAQTLATAKRKGWIHEGHTELKEAFSLGRVNRAPTLVVLCTPVDTLKNFLKRLDRLAPPGTLVTDTGSVKGFLVRWAGRRRWRHIQFVGAHPMAGSHEQGIAHADPHLFEGALTFVTPHRRDLAVRIVTNFWKKISQRVILVSPEEHDRITSEVSHLPHLVAALLVASVSPKNLPFAAAGFLDTTRVAEGDPALWVPILRENRFELRRSLLDFEARLRAAKKILRKGNPLSLRRILAQSQARRRSLAP